MSLSSRRVQSDLILLLVAMIWGSAFVVQRLAAQSIGVFLYNGARFFVAALFLLILMRFQPAIPRRELPLTAFTGLVLSVASALQQGGLIWTTAGNAGFITGLYVVFVPLLGVWLWKHPVPPSNWIAAAVAVLGAFLLSGGGSLQAFSFGDVLQLIGALFWALHVLLIGQGVQRMPALQFTFWQLIFAGLLNVPLALLYDLPTLAGVIDGWWTVLYVGIFSVGVGYTLQAVGQRHAPATDAVLILCLEAVFAAIFGWLFLQELLGPVQLLGCALILGASVFAQLRVLTGQPHADVS